METVTDPLAVLTAWRDEAAALGVGEPDAMALATSTPDGRPSVRMVLLRGLVGRTLRFYTNLESRKSEELVANPRAAAVFHWDILRRQVRVEGRVERLPDEIADEYFRSRPRGSQISAWASPQSRPITSEELDARVVERTKAFEGREVTRPPFWGGFAIHAERVELWTGRPDRLHERRSFVYDGARWSEVRLGP
jgi:pyridoxamine 5'-phosphate oxidase